MNKYLQDYWPVAISLVTIIISITAQWAIFGVRLAAIEVRQDRQDLTMQSLQDSLTTQETNYAALNAKMDALNDNVSYIRSRIDSVIK